MFRHNETRRLQRGFHGGVSLHHVDAVASMPRQRSMVEPFRTEESIRVERSNGEGGFVGRASERRYESVQQESYVS